MTMRLVLSLCVLVSQAGCYLYFGDDDPCADDGAGADLLPAGFRNPENGNCETPGGGGGCAVPLAAAEAAPTYQPDWAVCYGTCEYLAENECLAADACRAIYTDGCIGAGTEADCFGRAYVACFGTAPSGVIRGEVCAGKDAYECSRHDDCIAVHAVHVDGVGDFFACEAEPPTCPGAITPVSLRNPETGVCEDVGGCFDASGEPTGEDFAYPDWAACNSYCDFLGEDDCKAAETCRAIYHDVCEAECDAPILQFAACWGTAPTGPIGGGGCAPLDAQECSRHNDCSAVHGLGPAEFHWCQDEETAPPPPACEEVTDEVACVERADCAPTYEGIDCTCDAAGVCTCAEWVFVGCVTPT